MTKFCTLLHIIYKYNLLYDLLNEILTMVAFEKEFHCMKIIYRKESLGKHTNNTLNEGGGTSMCRYFPL